MYHIRVQLGFCEQRNVTLTSRNYTKLIMVSVSSHQNLAAEMRRETTRPITAMVDRMIKVMLHAGREVELPS